MLQTFLSTKKAQEIYTKKINEYSIREDVSPSKIVSSWGTFIADDLMLNNLSINIKKTKKVFNSEIEAKMSIKRP